MSAASTSVPIEWLQSLGHFLNDFYEAQCEIVRSSKRPATVKRTVPQSAQKIVNVRRTSLELSTPLKNKSPQAAINLTAETPSSTLNIIPSATPATEGRARRTAATKADKYIDIVSRRLAEVPANGSTPKSMKIASKLISEATPNSRRTILSQTLSKPVEMIKSFIQGTPKSKPRPVESIVPATPASVRKRNRAAKIHQLFQEPVIAQASSEAFSPSGITVAPSTISKASKLSQVHIAGQESEIQSKPDPAVSPLNNKVKTSRRASPLKEIPPKVSKRASPLKEPIVDVLENIPAAQPKQPAATPKAPVVEFVAPQSVLRSSKRPRKQNLYADDASIIASPAMKRAAQMKTLTDSTILPTVSLATQPQVKITPAAVEVVPVVPPVISNPLVSIASNARASSVSSVPPIIVPISASVASGESSSTEDLAAAASLIGISQTSTKRTPLRVQPSRTPTRAKAVIPSLSDYSASTKIAVIEVAKNVNHAPKVEPWTSKYMQKDLTKASIDANLTRTSLSVNIKPVDTSKISGFASASVPVVPKFPLNLANISNITKSSNLTILTKSENVNNTVINSNIISTSSNSDSMKNVDSNYNISNYTNSTSKSNVPQTVTIPQPPESPLSRAKRIDSENALKEEQLKLKMAKAATKEEFTTKAGPKEEFAAKATGSTTSTNNATISSSSAKPALTVVNSSKLPVKPKAAATVLPSPKVPSRLAEAFSGIETELPPIDIGLVDDDKVLKNVLSGASAKESTMPTGFANPKMKKPAPITVTSNIQNNSNNSNIVNSNNSSSAPNNVNNQNPIVPSTPSNPTTQLHKTAVMNSAARKITTNPQVQQLAPPSTPKPSGNGFNAISTPKPDSSSPFLPEIPSDDELLDRKDRAAGGKENRPTWAMTPNLAVALNAQRSQRPEDVFGKVQPIKLEDFFKGSGKKFPNRSSTSNWNNNI